MKTTKFDHHLQAKIFAKLRYSETLRYKDLKEPSQEPSQFMYHLRELITRKLVEKRTDGSYQLTGEGAELAQHFSTDAGNVRLGVLTYSLILLRSRKGNWLVVKRKKHPHINKYACISGKVHSEETMKQAAEREMAFFTGDKVKTPLEYRGSVSVMVESGGLKTHISGPVWFADNLEEVTLPDLSHAYPQWIDWRKLPYEEFIPGWKEIVSMIESGNIEFLDMSFKTD